MLSVCSLRIAAILFLLATTNALAVEAKRIVVLSDIHVFTDGRVASEFHAVVRHVVALKPDLVVITGDTTNGNERDRYDLEHARGWWRSALAALLPIREAGIPILPVAGNHDFYKPDFRLAYSEASGQLLDEFVKKGGSLSDSGHPPFYYSVDFGNAHLSLLHVVDQELEQNVADWLVQDLAQAPKDLLKIAFGHVPLFSVMGRTEKPFEARLGGLLARGGVAAYVSGHEHLVWDELVQYDSRPLRQLIVGTASGTYNFGPRPDVRARYCRKTGEAVSECRMPATGGRFQLSGSSKPIQKNKVAFALLETAPELSVTFYSLDASENLIQFYEKE